MTRRPVQFRLHYWLVSTRVGWQLAAKVPRGAAFNLGTHAALDKLGNAARAYIESKGLTFASQEWEWENSRIKLEATP